MSAALATKVHMDYRAACAALDEAQSSFYDQNVTYMDDGPRVAAMAGLAAARFAMSSAGSLLLMAVMPR